KTAPVQGRVLNTSLGEGDALIWRAYPQRQTFIDSRQHLFPPEFFAQFDTLREALRDDKVADWKPILDRYRITIVMLEEPLAPRTYQRMMQSSNWIAFYDDGKILLFGRADAPAADLAYFQAHRLDPDRLAYRQTHLIPPAPRPPSPVTWLDEIFQNRSL